MAIVINGSGTVTGLAVGGLPDGTVDTGTLAANSVVTGKIVDGTIASADIANLVASKLTGALPAISGASLTGVGITEADQWRLTTDFEGTVTTIASNLERNDTNFEKIGTGVSQSSGMFSFPSTGKWWVILNAASKFDEAEWLQYSLETSTNSSTTINTSFGAEAWYGGSLEVSNGGYRTGTCQTMIDVTNISNMRVRFRTQGSGLTRGKTTKNETTFTFIKLGET